MVGACGVFMQTHPTVVQSVGGAGAFGQHGCAKVLAMDIEAQAANYRADILQRYERLVRTLVQEGLLTDGEAKALPAPQITVIVQDRR